MDLDNCANTHICIDEVDVVDVPLEDLQKIQAKSIWTVIRDPQSKNPEEDLKEKLPGWHIVNLTHPLRTSKNISIKVKESGGDGIWGQENKFFLRSSKVESRHSKEAHSKVSSILFVFPEAFNVFD